LVVLRLEHLAAAVWRDDRDAPQSVWGGDFLLSGFAMISDVILLGLVTMSVGAALKRHGLFARNL
jgi:hypothetical protein